MIVYAACVADQEKFDTICRPGIARAFRDGDMMVTTSTDRSIFEAYNEVLDAFRDRDDLEALVLLHEDTEILGRTFAPRLLGALANPDIAVVGIAGGSGMRGIAWWEGATVGRVIETRATVDFGTWEGDVDAVDGMLMALSRWSVRHLRFDDRAFTGFDGYDADFCRQAREQGKRVRCIELPVAHRHDRDGVDRVIDDGGSFQRADAAFRMKWDPHAGPAPLTADKRVRVEEEWLPYLLPLVPASARRILDVGDDVAGRSEALRTIRPEAEVVHAATLDDVPAGVHFDTIVLPDVLERTLCPDAVLVRARELLADDGTLVFSVPNVGSYLFLLGLLEVGSNPTGWAFPQCTDTPLRWFTLDGLTAMADRTGLALREVFLSGYDMTERAAPLAAAAAAVRDAAPPPRPRGDASTDQRMSALRYYVTATVTGAAPPAPSAPRLGSVVDEPLTRLIAPAAQRVARIDLALPPDGDAVADDAVARAVAGLGDGPYDAIVLGTALDHIVHLGTALRAVRARLVPGGTVLATVTNLSRRDLMDPLLARDAWTYGEGALAHQPVRLFTRFDLSDVAADGGLVVEHVEDDPLTGDAGLAATWDEISTAVESRVRITEKMTVARLRIVMRRPGP